MSSILTNTSAMTALQTLKQVNQGLNQTQDRISTGLKIQSAKDNASYFSISQQMKGDSGMYKSINESLTMTANSVSTASLGASTVNDLAQQFVEQMSFAQGTAVDKSKIQDTLDSLVSQMKTTISQATFNGNNLVNGTSAVTVVTGISRSSGTFSTTTMSFNKVDLSAIASALGQINIATSTATSSVLAAGLATAQSQLTAAINAATTMGVAETSLSTQQDFLSNLTDKLDTGVGDMVDANMEEEAAKLQSYQVQQQLATQSLSIANQQPQNILSLFR
ncbi:flagellin N-terminal helical domain-containing protein [Acidimangrovimonas sediminis]|uniref:flagellin N-terminal helical domain-containing protein n=1 Tax=Acidimangrovimonas sediminis TaxID=2056283 RepID=UPI000C80E181|nr:flagellin [Acidimangrovimonas sediminis]